MGREWAAKAASYAGVSLRGRLFSLRPPRLARIVPDAEPLISPA
jgi:hypothetical protein